MTRFKFCGLSSQAELDLADDLGATYVGFVVQAPKSHRNLTLEAASELADAAPVGVRTVLVTPTDDGDALEQAVATVEPDVVQITGDPARRRIDHVLDASGVEGWRGVRLGADVDATLKRLAGYQAKHEAVVLDALEGGYGGTGETIDWATASAVVEQLDRFPIVLAGGLTPENVAEAIARVDPWCVDVSSGIETDGAKDPEQMRAFARAVRNQEVRR